MAGCWRTSMLVLVGIALAVSASGPIRSPEEIDREQETVQALSAFSVKLTKELLRERTGNVVVEPLGVATLLAELLQGVGRKSPTSNELQYALQRNVTEARVIGQVGKEVQNTRSPTTDVLISSQLFLAEGKNTTERYNNIMMTFFYNTVTTVPFQNPAVAADQINKWASRSTKGKVPSIVTPAALSPDTRLVLANAAYFKGVWESAFTANQTTSQWFYPSDKVPPVPVSMMHQVATLPANLEASSGAWWVRLPVNEKHAVVFVLPNRRFGLDEVVNRLSVASISEMARLPMKRTVDLYVPKFSVGSSQSLKSTLRNMGVRTIFDKNSYLTGILNNSEPLVVSDVLHRAKMDVDEKGVTAAAVSVAVVNTLTLASYSEDVKLYFDQPFLAIIVDQTTGLPIFISRIVNPAEVA